MNVVYCFSGTGHSRLIADYFAERLNCEVLDISADSQYLSCKTIVAVFPVYCQNIPDIVRLSLSKMMAESFVLIASYGRRSYGNVLRDAADIVNGKVIAGAYVPTAHTYLNDVYEPDLQRLDCIIDRINSPKEAFIPTCHKDFFADILPNIRSRVGVRIKRSKGCTHCGRCTEVCPIGAMRDGKPSSSCMRCLRCVSSCPESALAVKYNPILMMYLKSICSDEFPIFL